MRLRGWYKIRRSEVPRFMLLWGKEQSRHLFRAPFFGNFENPKVLSKIKENTSIRADRKRRKAPLTIGAVSYVHHIRKIAAPYQAHHVTGRHHKQMVARCREHGERVSSARKCELSSTGVASCGCGLMPARPSMRAMSRAMSSSPARTCQQPEPIPLHGSAEQHLLSSSSSSTQLAK